MSQAVNISANEFIPVNNFVFYSALSKEHFQASHRESCGGARQVYLACGLVVRRVCGNSSGFEVKVGMHQGSALSPLLFVIVMEAISREFGVALPWELLYADDLVVIAETEEDLIKEA